MRIGERLAIVVFVASAFSGAAVAQRTTFHPEVNLQQTYTENALFLAGQSETADTSDWITRLDVLLPLRREWTGGSWSLSYRPSFEQYSEFDALDHDEHYVAAALASALGRSASLGFDLNYQRSQQQGTTVGTTVPDRFVTTRTDRDVFEGQVLFRRETSERWRWFASVRSSTFAYRTVGDLSLPSDAPTLEDRTERGANVGIDRVLSRNTFVGAEYGYERYDLDVSGKETVHQLAGRLERVLGRGSSFALRLGGYRRQGDAFSGGGAIDGARQSGFQGGLTYRKSFRTSGLSVYADRATSSGGALEGTATDTIAGASLDLRPDPRVNWGVNARYAQRSPSNPAFSTVTNLAVGLSFEWRPMLKLGFRGGADYVDQSGSELAAQNTAFALARVGLVWYPRGPARSTEGGPGA